MEWIGDPIVSRDVVERRFDLTVDGRVVPGIVWTPDDATGPRPLVLVGHGASLHKSVGYVLTLARRLVRHHGYAVAAIDGPQHGDRVGATATVEGGVQRNPAVIPAWWSEESTDAMVADWKATLDALQKLDEIGTSGPVGYWGVSMGTIFGLPFVAAEPRIDVAALGLMGVGGPTRERIAADSASLSIPVLFVLQWDDELFPRDIGFELFAAIGTTDKRLHVNPGGHSALPASEFVDMERFLVTRLAEVQKLPTSRPTTS